MAASNKAIRSVITSQIAADPKLPADNSTRSLWLNDLHPVVGRAQSKKLPETSEYAVIGSGVASLGVTQSLLANGKGSVTVFEARDLCSGATGRNGGQLTRLPPTRHAFMAEQFGMQEANKIMRLTLDGLKAMNRLAEAQGESFLDATRRLKLEKFFAYYDEASWKETLEAVRLYERENPDEVGAYQLVTKEETAQVYHLNGAYGGLRFPAAVVSAYNLISGTFHKLQHDYPGRLNIETNTPVTTITYAPASNPRYPYEVTTPRGTVRAAKVIHCTNGWSAHLIPGLRGKMYPRRGTMSVQTPPDTFPDQVGKQSWSFYFTPEHEKRTNTIETGRYYGFQERGSGDLWIGGDRDALEGFVSADDSTIDAQAEENLRAVLPKLFGEAWVRRAAPVKGIWTGVMCYTGDQLPLVGKVPASLTGRGGEGEFMAGGWNSYGMTNGFICGDALGKMVCGLDVGGYFPDAYLITEERMKGERFEVNAVVSDFFRRVGAAQLAEPDSERARL